MNEQEYLTNLKGIRSQIDVMILEVESEDHLTNQEACRILNCCPATLSRYARVYKLKDRRSTGHKCYLKSEILRLKQGLECGKINFENSK